MPPDPVILASGLGKSFDLGASPAGALWNALAGRDGRQPFLALKDVDLTVWQGEAVGVVGLNGSGKSTLLQLICGTLEPSAGRVSVRGRIVAMLELGAGFNPDFTGRENAIVSAIAYGVSKSEAKARLGRIRAFADIGDYFERPVREYSSGMFMRLAFAVCAHVDADVMLIDEVLGVGDALFQQKCHRFLHGFLRHGTVLFVSHDLTAVASICSRAVLLKAGRKVAEGDVATVLTAYAQAGAGAGAPPRDAGPERAGGAPSRADPFWGLGAEVRVGTFDSASLRHGYGGCTIASAWFSTSSASPARILHGGEDVTLHIAARSDRLVERAIFGFILRNGSGQNLFGDNTYLAFRNRPAALRPGDVAEARFRFQFPYLPAGSYSLAPSVIEGTQQDHVHLDWREDALRLVVPKSEVSGGKIGLRLVDMRPLTEPHRPKAGR